MMKARKRQDSRSHCSAYSYHFHRQSWKSDEGRNPDSCSESLRPHGRQNADERGHSSETPELGEEPSESLQLLGKSRRQTSLKH